MGMDPRANGCCAGVRAWVGCVPGWARIFDWRRDRPGWLVSAGAARTLFPLVSLRRQLPERSEHHQYPQRDQHHEYHQRHEHKQHSLPVPEYRDNGCPEECVQQWTTGGASNGPSHAATTGKGAGHPASGGESEPEGRGSREAGSGSSGAVAAAGCEPNQPECDAGRQPRATTVTCICQTEYAAQGQYRAESPAARTSNDNFASEIDNEGYTAAPAT